MEWARVSRYCERFERGCEFCCVLKLAMLASCLHFVIQKVNDPEFGYLWKFNGKYWEERKERVERLHGKTNHNTDANEEKEHTDAELSKEVEQKLAV